MDKYEELKDLIDNSQNIVVFTGAGISCPPPTNIKDFRSADGLYSEKYKGKLNPEVIISHDFFMNNPEEFFEFYFSKMVFKNALCNKAHLYFSSLQKKHNVVIVTQNIDGLHSKAGNKRVYELHGSVFRNYCTRCHRFYSLDDIDTTKVPYCTCGGTIKPDVVLYGEMLNSDVIEEAINAIKNADLMIIVGTSLTVYPAASFVNYFKGNNLVLINKQNTQYDSNCRLVFNEDIISVIEKIDN